MLEFVRCSTKCKMMNMRTVLVRALGNDLEIFPKEE